MTYDVLGRVLTMEFPGNVAENVTYTYDDATVGNHGIGRLASVDDDSGSTSYVYDARGNVVQEIRVIGAQTYVTGYGYDLADRVASMTYPLGRVVEYGRDSLGRVTSVTTRESAGAPDVTLASAGKYEPFGALDGLTYGNGVTLALGYDLDGRITAIDTFNGATPVLDLHYDQYDLAGNILNITDVAGTGRNRTYAYDSLYRLTDASGGIPAESYAYDSVGNRLTRDVGGTPSIYVYDTLSNRLLSATEAGITRNLTYTASGNTEIDDRAAAADRSFAYDSTDRLVSVSEGTAVLATYLHNAQGQRVAKTVGAATTHYIYDSSGHLIAEADGTTGATTAEYVALEGTPLAFVVSGSIYFVHADHLGTPQVLTDGTTAAIAWDANYAPFGKTTVTGVLTFNQRFPGQYEDDETGLHYNYFRDYDPAIGRYVQSDPIGLQGGWNSYAYVGGNPVMLKDSIGLLARCPPGQELLPGCGPKPGQPGGGDGGGGGGFGALSPEAVIALIATLNLVSGDTNADSEGCCNENSPRPVLFRRGNIKDGPKLRDLRPDVDYDPTVGIVPLKEGLSMWEKPISSGHWYYFPINAPVPEGLCLLNDHDKHWVFTPKYPMSPEDYLSRVASTRPNWQYFGYVKEDGSLRGY